MRQWVILYSVMLTYSELYESFGVETSVSLEEMKCWHLSWKSLGRGSVGSLWSDVRATHGFSHAGVSSFGPPRWEVLRAHYSELIGKANHC